jgi:N-acetyl-anhydromuramyl-L-alanine amidase AmpD
MPLTRKWMPSPNYSSRSGGVRLLIIHTAEGAKTIESLGSFFSQSSAEVSSHTGADDQPGIVGEYVKPDKKAWTSANYNSASMNIELCGFAAWSRDEWVNRHDTMLTNTARWIQEEAGRYGIPLVRLSAGDAQGSGRGICGHGDLGSGGGGHTDPGPGFPWDVLMKKVGGTIAEAPGGAPSSPSSGSAPPFPGRLLSNYCEGEDVRQWQGQMSHRGWGLAVDGMYGGESERTCRSFQSEKGLAVDGVVGPETWAATWNAPIT